MNCSKTIPLITRVGLRGRSAYEDAVRNGFSGSLTDWLASLEGPAGISAYQLAVLYGDYEGTLEDWLLSAEDFRKGYSFLFR